MIEHLYSVEAGQLVLRPEFYDMRGWPEGEAEHYTPILLDCFDHGGWFLGLFDQGRLIGAVVLDPRRLGPERDWLQLKSSTSATPTAAAASAPTSSASPPPRPAT